MARWTNRFIALLWVAQTCLAQIQIGSLPAQWLAQKVDARYPIPGCSLLWNEEVTLQQYLAAHPEKRAFSKLMKTTAWNFHVGDARSWWTYNFETRTDYVVQSTCRVIGVNAYIFADDSLWNSGRITQAALDSVRVAFDERTPVSPTKGIFQLDVETFGNPPDVDNDPRIIILITDIKDGFAGKGKYIGGYFYSVNEYRDGTFPGSRSNEAEIYFVDADPVDLLTPTGLAEAASTTAHEFQHMIHFNYDPSELSFVNESCSETASVVCGYTMRDHSLYTDTTDVYLLGWSGSLAEYARASRWGLYLWNQFPSGFLKLLVANPSHGITGINSALAEYGTSRRFDDIFGDWIVANYLNDATIDPKYAYTFVGTLTKPQAITHVFPTVPIRTDTAKRLGADYVSFTGGSNLAVLFTSTSSDLHIKAIEIGPGSKRVLEVTPNAQFGEPGFGTTYSSITFAVFNSSETSDALYTYQATGSGATSVELKWDQTEPQGVLNLSLLDTLCVTFDAVPGGRLDSVRVALGRAGRVQGAVWRSTGVLRPSPLGVFLGQISASTNVTAPVVNPGATYPYPIPYPNWRTINLRSLNIPTDQPFVVGFWFRGATSDDAYVMVTQFPSTTAYHSYTYLHSPSSGLPDWYYSGGGGQVYLWLIRAYVSFEAIASLPIPPTLLYPADGARNISTHPTLAWFAVAGANSYMVQVSTDSSFFSSFAVNQSGVAGTSFVVPALSTATTYFWRVSATNSVGTGPFSATGRFTTTVAAPQAPVLAVPTDGAGNVSLNPVLTWNTSSSATSYRLQVSKNSGFVPTTIDDSTIAGTSMAIGPLDLATTYFWRVAARNEGGTSGFSVIRQFSTIRTTSVERLGAEIPKDFALSQNFPSPFNPSTTIQFALPKTSYVTLRAFDLLGREIALLLKGEIGPGYYSVNWDASQAPSGTYIYRLQAGDFVQAKKTILLR